MPGRHSWFQPVLAFREVTKHTLKQLFCQSFSTTFLTQMPQKEFQAPGQQQVTFVYSTHKDYSWNAEHSLIFVKLDNHSLPCLTKTHPSRTAEEQSTDAPPSMEAPLRACWKKPNSGITVAVLYKENAHCRMGEGAKFITSHLHIPIVGISSLSRQIFELLWLGTSTNRRLNVKFGNLWFQQWSGSWAFCMLELRYTLAYPNCLQHRTRAC